MAIAKQSAEAAFVIKRRYEAAREEVFEAWTNPEAIERWFAPGDEMTTRVVEFDLRVGGRYRIQMIEPEGNTYTVIGSFQILEPPNRLVIGWGWEPLEGEAPLDYSQSRVTVELREVEGGTELSLRHERLPNEEMRLEHEKGWNACLDRLPKAIRYRSVSNTG